MAFDVISIISNIKLADQFEALLQISTCSTFCLGAKSLDNTLIGHEKPVHIFDNPYNDVEVYFFIYFHIRKE